MLIEWNRLRELCLEIGPEDFDEIVEVFLEEVAEAIGQIDPNLDLAALEGRLHFVKSSALNLGFAGLAEMCRTGEALAAGGSRPDNQIAGIPGVFRQSLDEFHAGRGNIYAAA